MDDIAERVHVSLVPAEKQLLVFLYSSPFTHCSGLMARLGASRASELRRQEAVKGGCGCQRWFPHPSATRQPPRQDAHADETSLFHRSLRTCDSSVATGYLAGLFVMSVTSGEFVLCDKLEIAQSLCWVGGETRRRKWRVYSNFVCFQRRWMTS